MRDGLLHHRTLIAALVVTASLSTPWAAPAQADVAQVTVVSPGGAEQTLALEALAGGEDVVDRPYVVRGGEGESAVTVTGFSLAALLEAARADPYGFSFLEVQRPAGGAVLLSRHQALDPGAFGDGPPVVYATAGGTAFLRPSGGDGDLNTGDSFAVPQGISIVLRKGSQLRVRAKASPIHTKPGQPVSFEAIVERAGSGASLAFSWYFDDGNSGSGETARHSFAKQGSYDVVVGVTANGDDTGASDVVTVEVGAAPAGPNRKGGGRNETKNAPDHGSAARPSQGTGSGTPAAASPATTATEPGSESEPKQQAQPKAETKTKQAKQQPTGDLVSGELLGAPAEGSSQPVQPASARRGRLEGSSDGGGVPAAAWGVLATLGLLGAGALVEARALGPGLRALLWRGGPA
ncbi:MAG TPA: PKD domain-containing protein [Solirubrobacterales bacterium]|nr:PKD domain-containing protein [Solirubrobacterales bacterium]